LELHKKYLYRKTLDFVPKRLRTKFVDYGTHISPSLTPVLLANAAVQPHKYLLRFLYW